jgi:hypothetical protein
MRILLLKGRTVPRPIAIASQHLSAVASPRFSQVSSLDEQPMTELNSEAIDFRAASEFFRSIRKLTRFATGSVTNFNPKPSP